MPQGRMTGTSSVQQMKDALLEFFFPDRCIGCRRVGTLLCAHCAAKMRRYPSQVLLSLPPDAPSLLQDVGVVYVYEGTLRKAIHALKYEQLPRIAVPLGLLLAHYVYTNPLPADVVIPVPLHPRRLQQRGYNQSELLARTLAAHSPLTVLVGRLERQRDTPAQVNLNAWQRQINMRDAFLWRGTEPPPARVLLLDDVLTTGATLFACASVLRSVGVREVRALALARSQLDAS